MMEVVTWASVLILGPGSVARFVWFLVDLSRGRDRPAHSPAGSDAQAEPPRQ